MVLTEEFINKFKYENYLYTDKIAFLTEINKMSYYEFYNFINLHFDISYTVNISLKIWYILLTKKCNFCNNDMIITPNGLEHQHYHCKKCNKNYNFDNYDVDDYTFYNFITNIKK